MNTNDIQITNKYPSCFYRVSIKGIIVSNNKLLLIKENSKRWDLLGGGIEHFEDISDALNREIFEEAGVKLLDIDFSSLEPWFTFDYDIDWCKPILYLVYKIKIDIDDLNIPNNSKVNFFSKSEFNDIQLEKHIEKFRIRIIEKAFGSYQYESK